MAGLAYLDGNTMVSLLEYVHTEVVFSDHIVLRWDFGSQSR
jgi:hypothetical protein